MGRDDLMIKIDKSKMPTKLTRSQEVLGVSLQNNDNLFLFFTLFQSKQNIFVMCMFQVNTFRQTAPAGQLSLCTPRS
jgi:hypothetical protein